MESQSSVFIRHYDKQSLKVVDVISGISPNAMRRVFGGWIFFAAVVGVIVSVAPDFNVIVEVLVLPIVSVLLPDILSIVFVSNLLIIKLQMYSLMEL